jgi:hypothetical protein
MDSVSMASGLLGMTQQMTQQSLGIAALKIEMQAQSQVANLLAASAQQSLATSGSVGTQVNTFA